MDGDRGLVTLRRAPTPSQLEDLRGKIPMFNEGLGYRMDDDTTLSFNFDGRNYLYLRRVIDDVNSWSS